MAKFVSIATAVFIIAGTAGLQAQQKVYTWTDAKGRMHITDQPPPGGARVEDVTTYRERSETELDAIERRIEARRQEREREREQDRRQEMQTRAEEAREDARRAQERAVAAEQEARKTYEIYGTTQEKRKQFRKRIQRAFDAAEAARQQALQADEKAEKMTIEARSAGMSTESEAPSPAESEPAIE
jgi:hypothetical protein